MADASAALDLIQAELFSNDEDEGDDLFDFAGAGILDDLLDLEPSVGISQQIVSVPQEYERPPWPLAEAGQFIGQSACGGPLPRKDFVSDFIQIRQFKEACLSQLQEIQAAVELELGTAATPPDVSCDSVQERPVEQMLHEMLYADLQALHEGGRAGDTVKRSPFIHIHRRNTRTGRQAEATRADAPVAQLSQPFAKVPIFEDLGQPLEPSPQPEVALQDSLAQSEPPKQAEQHLKEGAIVSLPDLPGVLADVVSTELELSELGPSNAEGLNQDLDHESLVDILKSAGLKEASADRETSFQVELPVQDALGQETQQPSAENPPSEQAQLTTALADQQLEPLVGPSLSEVAPQLTLTPNGTQAAAGFLMEIDPTIPTANPAMGSFPRKEPLQDTGAAVDSVPESAGDRADKLGGKTGEYGNGESNRAPDDVAKVVPGESNRAPVAAGVEQETDREAKEKEETQRKDNERKEKHRKEKRRKEGAERGERRGAKRAAKPAPLAWSENEMTQNWVRQLTACREYKEAMRNQAPLRCIRETLSDQRASINHKRTHRFTQEEAFPPWLDPVPQEAVISVRVFDASNRNTGYQEHLVLASQRLTQFRDSILCPLDTLVQAAGADNPSGYFLIEETFFDDMRRGASAVRYSTPIVEWAAAQRPPSGSTAPGAVRYGQRDMEDFVFEDLNVRVGAEYLYCHQGNCEHRMVFTDVRLLNRFDSLDLSSYPLLRYRTKYPPKKCHICGTQPASKITVGDELVPESPCLFCEQCFDALHRTKAGELHPSDLEMYPYTPDMQL